MRTSRIRYYESRALLPPAARVSGKRRYTEDVLRRLAIIDAAQRIGFSLDEIGDLLGSRDRPAHERLRQLALLKLPEIDGLIERATAVRGLLEMCSTCNCKSLEDCALFDDRYTRLSDDRDNATLAATRRVHQQIARLFGALGTG